MQLQAIEAIATTETDAANLDYARSHIFAAEKLLICRTVANKTAPTLNPSRMQSLVTSRVADAVGSSKNPAQELSSSPLTNELEAHYAA